MRRISYSLVSQGRLPAKPEPSPTPPPASQAHLAKAHGVDTLVAVCRDLLLVLGFGGLAERLTVGPAAGRLSG